MEWCSTILSILRVLDAQSMVACSFSNCESIVIIISLVALTVFRVFRLCRLLYALAGLETFRPIIISLYYAVETRLDASLVYRL